ncbi:MAG: hypothetical protein ACI4SO_08375 [Muribaculaceae bacterium]
MLALALALSPIYTSAALPKSGEWDNCNITEDEEVTLEGDVYIKQWVYIFEGKKLTINAGSYTIYARYYDETANSGNGGNIPISFKVNKNAELVIIGDESNRMTIAGPCTKNYGYDGSGEDPSFAHAESREDYYFCPENGGYVPDDVDKYMSNFMVVDGGGKVTLKNANIKNIRNVHYFEYASVIDIGGDGSGGDVNVSVENVDITNCMSCKGAGVVGIRANAKGTVNMTNVHISNSRAYQYGGVLAGCGGGDPSIVVTMNNCEMNNCISSGWGGAILWASKSVNGTKLVLNNCKLHDNYARCIGGAISNEGTVELNGCTVENNWAGYAGGGIATMPFTLDSGTGDLNGLSLGSGNIIRYNKTIYTNSADQERGKFKAFGGVKPTGGGGIWILMNLPGWTCNSVIGTGNEIYKNESAYAGGGILLYKSGGSTTSLTSAAKIYENKSTTAGGGGGGIAIGAENVTELPSVTINGGEIYDNASTDYHGGGVYMPGGKFKMTAGSIRGNSAALNGGGFYIQNGNVEITSPDAQITGNRCGTYGAGLYVGNTGSTTVNTTFSGGTIKGNGVEGCIAGGGICVEGNVNFTTRNTNIEDNVAGNARGNGGGICVIGGAKMTYESGRIRNNKAIASGSYNTGYQKGVDEIGGFGGGVFVSGAGSSLTFSMGEGVSLGLYGNTASNGGDDIFASGSGTTVTIPNVTDMTLTDFDVPVSESSLFWAEDYVTNDPYYGEGTKINSGWSGTNLRYRDTLKAFRDPYKVSFAESTYTLNNKYTSLALGYGMIFATIEKTGLRKGESAIFDVINTGDGKKYYSVVLTGTDDAGSKVQRRVGLFPGEWKVVETPWSWTYSGTVEDNTITKTITEGAVFSFTNEKQKSAPHSESSKVNEFK